MTGADPAVAAYQIHLMVEAGLVHGHSRLEDSIPLAFATRLTWEGHELLDKIKSEGVWNKIKSAAKEKGIELSFDAVKMLGKAALGAVLGSG